MNFHWSILSTNLKYCCPTKMRQICNILPELHWRKIVAIKRWHKLAAFLPKLQWRNSKMLAHEFSLEHSFNKLETLFSFSPWIFIGAFFQQTWNIVVLQRNHCFVVRKWPFFLAPNPWKQPQQHFIISLCKNLVVFASILFTISSLNLPSRGSFRNMLDLNDLYLCFSRYKK